MKSFKNCFPWNGFLATYSSYFCLENPMDRGAWWAIAHRVTKSRTQLNIHQVNEERRFPGGASCTELVFQCRRHKRCELHPWVDVSCIPELGRSPGGGHSDPLQYSCLRNLMDRGAWQVTVHMFAKSRTGLKRLSMHACKWRENYHQGKEWVYSMLQWHMIHRICLETRFPPNNEVVIPWCKGGEMFLKGEGGLFN